MGWDTFDHITFLLNNLINYNPLFKLSTAYTADGFNSNKIGPHAHLFFCSCQVKNTKNDAIFLIVTLDGHIHESRNMKAQTDSV